MRLWQLMEQGSTKWYHGTSRAVVDSIMAGNEPVIKRVYDESNISLGGAYLTTRGSVAQFAAKRASAKHKSPPVVLEIAIKYPLYPDEDWVVEAAEAPHEDDFDEDADEWTNERYRWFFRDLFAVYDGTSLSDAYKEVYDELNAEHGITWEDSVKYVQSARQKQPLTRDQIISGA